MLHYFTPRVSLPRLRDDRHMGIGFPIRIWPEVGYHVLRSGGHFDVHADRNFDHNTGLTRRLALITYLNRDWRKEYGGQLELWATDASRCESVIEPEFNTTILFEVGDQTFMVFGLYGLRKIRPESRSQHIFILWVTPRALTIRPTTRSTHRASIRGVPA